MSDICHSVIGTLLKKPHTKFKEGEDGRTEQCVGRVHEQAGKDTRPSGVLPGRRTAGGLGM